MAPRLPHVQLVVDTGSTHPTQSDGDVGPLAHYITIASAPPGSSDGDVVPLAHYIAILD